MGDDAGAMGTAGFDQGFLGVECGLPRATEAERRIRELTYLHFTVLLDAGRKLAAVAAANIDGAALRDIARGDDWHLDERVDAAEQTGPEVYARNDLDRGHLVRRRDPVWGPMDAAERANRDTFAYTNAAPQAAEFNQSKELWNGLEDHVLEYASANRLRLSVFTGPVFGDDDVSYRGTRIPTRFWKVAAWADATGSGAGSAPEGQDPARLRAAGFLLDQSPQLDGIELEGARAAARATDAPPPLGPFRTFQLGISDIAGLTALDFGPIPAADAFADAATARPGTSRAWTELHTPGQIVL
ncbi:DNA/RNA non-specific endonuclease [Herbiconiux sp.]|uniref:DNA/RNA non-specific endonuclease n=1 Tax=Herbiconiux sp. TaxID=1871186 RepID=UPI0025C71B6E|nr:DNA/RNA non-specific endonuclease [Herbiconiux sp.]